ncbi:MAG: PEPxxWA-CTERM sorting domain-containing protein [Pseudomonadota bacterium]|uniref:PEPxxWA-CTERM sorting domain-containing protein n=1 Tax=Phenylobacterium sp. TaxID=1871053 RepID=UPI0025D9AF5F|nr:PEPxxWA-CTERM sorting domain-containing protein [Phenylobacterium sp.]
MKLQLLCASVAFALAATVTTAQAATWDITFTGLGSGANTDTAAFTLLTADTLNSAGGYNILGATGAVNGVAITGLISPGTAGAHFVSANGMWNLDNVLFLAAPHQSNNGWGFTLAGGSEVNFWATAPSSTAVVNGAPGSGNAIQFGTGSKYSSVRFGTIDLTSAVPEPATWALMICGFGLAGATLRQRRLVAA